MDQVAAELDESFRGKIARWQKGSADIDAWAWESYQLAVKDVYGKLPVRIPVESPQPVSSCTDDNHVSARMLKLDEHLADPYQNMAVPIIRAAPGAGWSQTRAAAQSTLAVDLLPKTGEFLTLQTAVGIFECGGGAFTTANVAAKEKNY